MTLVVTALIATSDVTTDALSVVSVATGQLIADAVVVGVVVADILQSPLGGAEVAAGPPAAVVVLKERGAEVNRPAERGIGARTVRGARTEEIKESAAGVVAEIGKIEEAEMMIGAAAVGIETVVIKAVVIEAVLVVIEVVLVVIMLKQQVINQQMALVARMMLSLPTSKVSTLCCCVK